MGGQVRVYQTSDGARVATLEGHGGAVFSVVFTPDGQRILTGGFDGLIRAFSATDGKLTAVLVPVPLVPPQDVVTK